MIMIIIKIIIILIIITTIIITFKDVTSTNTMSQ